MNKNTEIIVYMMNEIIKDEFLSIIFTIHKKISVNKE